MSITLDLTAVAHEIKGAQDRTTQIMPVSARAQSFEYLQRTQWRK